MKATKWNSLQKNFFHSKYRTITHWPWDVCLAVSEKNSVNVSIEQKKNFVKVIWQPDLTTWKWAPCPDFNNDPQQAVCFFSNVELVTTLVGLICYSFRPIALRWELAWNCKIWPPQNDFKPFWIAWLNAKRCRSWPVVALRDSISVCLSLSLSLSLSPSLSLSLSLSLSHA